MLEMALYLLKSEGLCVGGSSAINIVAACREARRLKQNAINIEQLEDSCRREAKTEKQTRKEARTN